MTLCQTPVVDTLSMYMLVVLPLDLRMGLCVDIMYLHRSAQGSLKASSMCSGWCACGLLAPTQRVGQRRDLRPFSLCGWCGCEEANSTVSSHHQVSFNTLSCAVHITQ